ncbi:hypothetical protein V8C44DRAFT_249289 [Trichoderma aethiopicum]
MSRRLGNKRAWKILVQPLRARDAGITPTRQLSRLACHPALWSPSSGTPTLPYANCWRHCTRYTSARGSSVLGTRPMAARPQVAATVAGPAQHAAVPAKHQLSLKPWPRPQALSAVSSPERRSQCLGRCRARIRGRSYPWISCWGRFHTRRAAVSCSAAARWSRSDSIRGPLGPRARTRTAAKLPASPRRGDCWLADGKA